MTVAERFDYLVDQYQLNPVFALRVAKETNDISPDTVSKYIKEKPKPFVKWVGGKRQLLTQLKEKGLYPPSNFNPTKNTYFRTFVGFFDFLSFEAFQFYEIEF